MVSDAPCGELVACLSGRGHSVDVLRSMQIACAHHLAYHAFVSLLPGTFGQLAFLRNRLKPVLQFSELQALLQSTLQGAEQIQSTGWSAVAELIETALRERGCDSV